MVDSDRPEGSKFRLTGKGVDQEPKGIFRINENTGSVSVTRSLDREVIATYQVSGQRQSGPRGHFLSPVGLHDHPQASAASLRGLRSANPQTQQQWGTLPAPPGAQPRPSEDQGRAGGVTREVRTAGLTWAFQSGQEMGRHRDSRSARRESRAR